MGWGGCGATGCDLAKDYSSRTTPTPPFQGTPPFLQSAKKEGRIIGNATLTVVEGQHVTTPAKRYLHYGDNLHVLRAQVPSDSVDLIYLDPPFNSNANYNVLIWRQWRGWKN
jgi:hypothetical protein